MANRPQGGNACSFHSRCLRQPAMAQKKYDPGASDTEIKLGQTMPYSGPLSGFITLAKAEIAYFQMINDQGGVNGRKINMISLDDGFSPPKTVEQTRRLVEQDQVLAISGSLGTSTNAAVQKYLNGKKMPQLFLATGASRWNDPKNFPYTMTLTPIYQAEARIYATYMLKEVKDPKVAVLYQNDDFGKDFLKGFRDRLGDKANSIIVREVSYEVTDATVDSQIIDLASTKANVFLNITTPKFAVQAIRKAHELGWKPLQFIDNPAASIGIVMRPAGIEASKGIVSAAFVKDPTDPQYKDDPEFLAWVAWMKKYYPAGSLEDPQNVVGYIQAQAMVQVLKQCGDTSRARTSCAGRQPQELPSRHAAQGHQHEHQPDRLPADGGDGAAALQRRALRGVRRASERPTELNERRQELRQMAKRKSINYPGFKHENPIPNASRIGNILMSSIISGRDPQTSQMPPELDAQVTNIFKQIKLCVEAAGGTVDDIIKVNFWMKDPATGRKALNGEWSTMFPGSRVAAGASHAGAAGERGQPRDLRLHGGDRRLSTGRILQCRRPLERASGSLMIWRSDARGTTSMSGRWRSALRANAPEIRRSATAEPTNVCGSDGGGCPCWRSRFSTQAARRLRELPPGRRAVELLQQALVVIGVLVAGAAAEARRGRRRPPPARCGWAGASRR